MSGYENDVMVKIMEDMGYEKLFSPHSSVVTTQMIDKLSISEKKKILTTIFCSQPLITCSKIFLYYIEVWETLSFDDWLIIADAVRTNDNPYARYAFVNCLYSHLNVKRDRISEIFDIEYNFEQVEWGSDYIKKHNQLIFRLEGLSDLTPHLDHIREIILQGSSNL